MTGRARSPSWSTQRAIPLSFDGPWIAFACYVMVAVMWLLPDPRIEKTIGAINGGRQPSDAALMYSNIGRLLWKRIRGGIGPFPLWSAVSAGMALSPSSISGWSILAIVTSRGPWRAFKNSRRKWRPTLFPTLPTLRLILLWHWADDSAGLTVIGSTESIGQKNVDSGLYSRVQLLQRRFRCLC